VRKRTPREDDLCLVDRKQAETSVVERKGYQESTEAEKVTRVTFVRHQRQNKGEGDAEAKKRMEED